MYRIYPRVDERDLKYLKREFSWFDRKWKAISVSNIFKPNEEELIRKVHSANSQILFDLENYIIGLNLEFNSNELKEEDKKQRTVRLDEAMKQAEIAIEILVIEFWKTDTPIDL